MILDHITHIAFDLDGTLLDSVPDLTLAVDKAMRDLGRAGVSEAQVQEWVGNGADSLVARALSQSIEIAADLDAALKREARALFDRHYAECGHQRSGLYPGVRESLQRLVAEGYQLAIITNKPYQFVPEILEQQQILALFDEILGGDSLPKRKPDPMPLHYLMDKYQLAPANLLMVGDSKNDILAAQNAGIASVALPYGYNHGEPIANANPDFLLSDLTELASLLAKN